MTAPLRQQYLLNPDVVFLNHGSFGACPRPVFEVYQQWQLELESEPVEFIARRSTSLLAEARTALAEFLHTGPDNLVYVTNSTTAFNLILRSLHLQAGDEVLMTDQEYPAMNQAWDYYAHHTGVVLRRHPTPMPFTTPEDFIENFWRGVTPRTRVIHISHIIFTLGIILPVQEICRRAREAGILTIVDGAHAPGQIPLNLDEFGADLYFGACHKWLSAPKGASFLYARPEIQPNLDPLIISRGWGDRPTTFSPSRFIEFNEYQGTRDLSAFLSVPAAIQFQKNNHWQAQQERCHALAVETRRHINALSGFDSFCPDEGEYLWFQQLASVRIPPVNSMDFVPYFFEKYHIEVPVIEWECNPTSMRISFQAYNSQTDADALVAALAEEFNWK